MTDTITGQIVEVGDGRIDIEVAGQMIYLDADVDMQRKAGALLYQRATVTTEFKATGAGWRVVDVVVAP